MIMTKRGIFIGFDHDNAGAKTERVEGSRVNLRPKRDKAKVTAPGGCRRTVDQTGQTCRLGPAAL
jgi:hypothetical protein